jgi:hypothetical protein
MIEILNKEPLQEICVMIKTCSAALSQEIHNYLLLLYGKFWYNKVVTCVRFHRSLKYSYLSL